MKFFYCLYMLDIIDELKSELTSNVAIEHALRGTNTKVIFGKQLGEVESFDRLFGTYDNLVILFEINDDFGHYTAALRYPNRILIFDCYGKNPLDFKAIYDRSLNDLLLRASDDGYQIEYNEYPLQKEGEDIATCGKWVIARIKLRDLSTDEFMDVFRPMDIVDPLVDDDEWDSIITLTPDDLVILYAQPMMGGYK